MKIIYSKLLLFVVLFLVNATTTTAQCGTNTASGSFCTRSNVFSVTALPDLGCGVYRTLTNYSPGTYFRIPVLAGGCYSVQTCGAPIDTQIGIFQGTTTTNPFAYNDDNGPLCTGTAASVNFTPTFNDYVGVDVRQYNCQPGGSSSITVNLRQNNNLNITSSAASMCAGQTRTLTATPTPTIAFTAGAGNGGTFSGTGVSGTTFTAPTPVGASQVYTITYTFGYCTTTQNITVFRNPSTANAGPNQTVSCNATTTTLAATAPVYGTGVWTLISGTGTITTPTSPTSTVTGLTPGGTSVFRWTVTNGPCTSSISNVSITSTADFSAPVPDLASLPDITAQCELTSLTAPTATDNCSGAVSATTGTMLPITTQGTTVVTWTFTDGSGNLSTQNQNIVITDNTPPVPDLATLSDVTAECEVTSLTAPTATDNCGGIVTVSNDATLPITSQGTTVVTWTYTDVNGNSSTQNQNIVITDVTSPVADIPILADITAVCSVTSLTAPTATDNCSVLSVTNNASLPITTQGTTVVTWTYTDSQGNSSSQNQNVVIIDNIPPVPSVVSLPDVTAQCIVTSLTEPAATDNCGGTVAVTNDASLPISTQGTTVVTWTYTDLAGNESTQTQNVVITDNTPPVPSLATLPDITDQCSVSSLIAPTATDACGSPISITSDAVLPITTQGTTIITWTYTDNLGNSSTQTQNVVITDNTPPVPTLAVLPDETSQCEVTFLNAPTATDNCGGTVIVTNDAVLPISTIGTTVVTWTYTDAVGNASTQTQNIVVSDLTAPLPDVIALADVTSECSVTSLTPPTATDNCGGVVTVTNDATLPITTQGTTVVTWTYTDGAGNASTQTQNVVITDVTAPVADLATLADITAECSVTSLTTPTATDICGGVVTVTNNVTLPITTQGTTVVTWTYTDGVGNASTQTQNIIITDVTAPLADLATLVDITNECAVTTLTPPTATDNCGGTVSVTNDATLPITTQGTTVVTWTYTDVNGNSSTQTQNVVIDDVTAPLADVAALADVNAECEVTSLTAPTATDNCGGLVTVTNDALLPITTQGTTVVTWTYTDVNGNSSTQTQNVVIDDVTAPLADVAALADVNAECEVTSLTAPTATDNCVGAVVVTNDATLPITTQGTTVVTWTYTDGVGNASTQTQNFVITDVTAPIADVATLTDVTAECEVTSLTPPTATDNCGGTVTVTNDATLPISTQGTTIVTWTYTDVNGNSSTQTQNVVIDDVTAPLADLVTLADVSAECSVSSLTPPTATDNCSGTVTVSNDATLPISTQGTTIVTWTYDDGNGNTSTQTQNIVINDITAPVADVPSLADVTAECEITSLTAPTASDNCSGTITVTNDATLPISTQGTTVVTWTYDDGNGNTSTQTQNVVIDDVTAPVGDIGTLADVMGGCEVTSLIPPTATDNCGGTVTVTNDAILPISTSGTTVVTWTYDDGNGNTSTQTQNVVLIDVEGPLADSPVLVDITGVCSVDAPMAPTATDNCAGIVIGTTSTAFPITTIGTTTVIWEYADGNGNITSQTQDFVISGVDVSTTLSGDGTTITANNALGTYQWIDCSDNSIIAGSTNQDFSPAANGDYAVIVTEGSCVDTSACVTVSTIGIETLSIVQLKVYPNPTLDGLFTISYEGTIEAIEVFDMLGRAITLPIDLNSGNVDGSALEDGRYILRVKTDRGYAMSEIVVAN